MGGGTVSNPMTSLDDLIREADAAGRIKRARWSARRWCRRVVDAPQRTRTDALCAWQRVRRGWDVRSVWSLDSHLTRQLGEQLTYMADIAHGWPSGHYETSDEWVAALRNNGAALLAYAHAQSELPLVPDDVKDQARDALRWVADNLGMLWD